MLRRLEVAGGLNLQFQINPYNNSGATGPVAYPTNFTATALPFNTLVQSARVDIGGSSISTPTGELLPLTKAQLSSKELRRCLGAADSVPTICANSSQEAGIPCNAFSGAPFDYDTPYSHLTEGSWTGAAGTVGAPISGTLNVCEPLLVSPFTAITEDDTLVNLDVVYVTLELADLSQVKSCPLRFSQQVSGKDVAITGMQFAASPFSADFCLRATFLTDPVPQPPLSSLHAYMQPQVFKGKDVPYDPSTPFSQVLTSEQLQMPVCPDFLAVFVVATRPAGGTTPVYANSRLQQSLAFAPIRNLNLTWNNTPNLLNTVSQTELWRSSFENGVTVPWWIAAGCFRAWTGEAKRTTVGAPLLLRVGTDIPVPVGVTPGCPGDHRLTVTATLAHFFDDMSLAGTNGSFMLYVVPITESYLRLNPGATSELLRTVVPVGDSGVQDTVVAPAKRMRAYL